MRSRSRSLSALALAAGAVLGLVGCGGHGGSSSAAAPSPTTVTGGVHAGVVGRALVSVYAVDRTTGALTLLGSTATDGRGAFRLSFSGQAPFLFVATQGTYPDEATGRTRSLADLRPARLDEPRAGTLEALAGAGCESALTVFLNPLTTLASHRLVERLRVDATALDEPAVAAENRRVADLLGLRDAAGGFDPRAVRPLDLTDPADAAAIEVAPRSQAALLGGLLGGLSRQALDLGLQEPLDLVDGLSRDYEADGLFDGQGPGAILVGGQLLSPRAGTSDLRRANQEFLDDPLRNRSAVRSSDQPSLIEPPAGQPQPQPPVVLPPTNLAPDLVVADATADEDQVGVTVELAGVTAGSPAEDATQTVTLVAVSDAPDLVADTSLVVTGAGATRTLSLELRPNASGAATISVGASDGALVTTRTFTLTVSPVNDPPTLAQPDVSFGTQNVAAVVSLSGIGPGGGPDEAGQAIAVVASALTPNAVASLECSPITSGSATLTVVPLLGWAGVVPVSVTVEDALGGQTTRTVLVLFAPPVLLEKTAGDGQTGAAGELLAGRLVVTARDAYGRAVPRVPVVFAPAGAGVALVQSSAETDGDGQAGTLVQLPSTPGAAEVVVSSPLIVSSVSFSATGVAGAPATLEPLQPPPAVTLATPFSLALQLLDRHGNLATSSLGATVAIATNPTGATLGGTLEQPVAGGLVTFSDLTLDAAGDGYALEVTFPGLAPAVVTLSVTPAPLAWTAGAMACARHDGAAATSSSGTTYFVGGRSTTSAPLATVDLYVAEHDFLWQLQPGLSSARVGPAAVCLGERLYVLGGGVEVETYDYVNDEYILELVSQTTVESYEPGLGWRAEPALPEGVMDAAAAVGPDGAIYVIGGRQTRASPHGSYSEAVAFVQRFDPLTGWTRLADLPSARSGAGAALGPDGRLYVVGGSADGPELTLVEAYDPATGAVTPVAPMATGRSNAAVFRGPDGRIYAAGGRSGSVYPYSTAAMEVYSTTTGAWTAGTELLAARARGLAAVGGDGRLVVAGGQGAGAVTSIERYGPSLRIEWSQALGWHLIGTGFADGAAYEVRDGGPTGEVVASGTTSGGGFTKPIAFPAGTLWARDARSLYPVTCRPPA